MQKSLSPAEAANVVAECRKVPHVKNALFEYTKHEVRAFLRYVLPIYLPIYLPYISLGARLPALRAQRQRPRGGRRHHLRRALEGGC